MTRDPVDILRELIPIDSRNTTPLDKEGPREADEQAMCAFLVDRLKPLGFDTAVSYAAPNRPNLVATREQVPDQPFIAFQAHMDTVGTEGMTIDPFDPVVRNGCVFGRGACDTKGGMAAMLSALEMLVADDSRVNLMFVASCAEETGCQGAPAIDLAPWDVGGMLVGEPTSNRAVNCHKANGCFELICHGTAAHGAHPENGLNAIYRAAQLIHYLRQSIIPELAAHHHPAFDGSTLAVTLIDGGTKGNIIPDTCTMTCDLRLVPGHGPTDAFIHRLAENAARTLGFDVAVGWMHTTPGLDTPADHPFSRCVVQAMHGLGLSTTLGAVNYCTDGGVFGTRGIPALVLGPGDIRQAHGAVEFVPVDQLRQAAEIYRNAALSWARLQRT